MLDFGEPKILPLSSLIKAAFVGQNLDKAEDNNSSVYKQTVRVSQVKLTQLEMTTAELGEYLKKTIEG